MSRPKAVIDWQKAGQLYEAGATTEGVAATFGVSPDTLYKVCQRELKIGLSAFVQEKRAKGDELLRAKQFGIAMSGNVTMLIWLGKQRLGQSEKQEITGKDGAPQEHKVIVEFIDASSSNTATD